MRLMVIQKHIGSSTIPKREVDAGAGTTSSS